MARTALGGRIDLDPMSETKFNRVVGADRILTKRDNGLTKPWIAEAMLINPAGGLVVEAWRKLVAEWESGNVQRAIWIGFSVEQLNLLADEPRHPHDFSLLTCRKRISFVRHDGYTGAPGHANYVVGLGIAVASFQHAFAGRGRFDHGSLAVQSARSAA